jgi:hypothetical protein
MVDIYQKLIVAASTALGYLTLTGYSAYAAIFTSDFDVNITSGPLTGQVFSGFVSYDDTQTLGRGPFFEVTDFELMFDGVTYTDVNPLTSNLVVDRAGGVVGLRYTPPTRLSDTAFLFRQEPMNFSAGTGTFAYGTPTASGGFQVTGVGEVVFSLRTDPKPIPELTKYAFTIAGFSGGGTLSGTFEGFDFNQDGFLDGDDFFTRALGIEVYEISNFKADFTGDSIVPDLTFSQQDILENGLFYQNGWRFLPDGKLSLEFFDTESQVAGLFTNGDEIIVGNTIVGNSIAISTELIIATPIPEVTPILGLSALGLGFILKKRH